ncbi:MAG: hypothetical protein Q7S22_06480 [Candidatus Micrarchaeota archaeon]|nr:hypothetical protein [Candidatus Micrarchaeota archaeon]
MVAVTRVRKKSDSRKPVLPQKIEYTNPYDDPSEKLILADKPIRVLLSMLSQIVLLGDVTLYAVPPVREAKAIEVIKELKKRDINELRDNEVLRIMLTRLTVPGVSENLKVVASELYEIIQ